jgi:hypothetical protein
MIARAYMPSAFLRAGVAAERAVTSQQRNAMKHTTKRNMMGVLIREPGPPVAVLAAVVPIAIARLADVVGVTLKVPVGNVQVVPAGKAPQVNVTLIVSVEAEPPTALKSKT